MNTDLNRALYYRRDGTPLPNVGDNGRSYADQWQDVEETFRNNRVCLTVFWWGGYLSTVFLVIDYSWIGSSEPILFETVLFVPSGAFVDQWRYRTEAEAIRKHSELVRHYKNPWVALQCYLHYRVFK